MNNLTLNLNKEALLDLMKNFNLLTGIKIALFDTAGNEILSYPEKRCPFCQAMRSTAAGEAACLKSNNDSFLRAQESRFMEIFTCHAGLIETTAPLIDNGQIIGYIMFGQITNKPEKSEIHDMLYQSLAPYRNKNVGTDASIYSAEYKSNEQIRAAAKILEACTFYVLLSDMISLRRETFMENLDQFLMAHLSEDLSVSRLTAEFHVSKNKLYESCDKYLPTGIAEHVKLLRIEEAKRLLKETDLPVNEISDKVGFNDYNYFCRVFKATVGTPAMKYRKDNT